MAAADIQALAPYTALIRRDDAHELIPGAFVQGPSSPCIITCLHAFEPIGLVGSELDVQLQAPLEHVRCKVFTFDCDLDFLILEVLTPVNRITAVVDSTVSPSLYGQPYILFGNSTCNGIDANGRWRMVWNVTRGHFSSQLLDNFQIAAGGGSAPGDSGGPLFHGETGKLIGINVSISLLPVGNDFQATSRARASPQGRMVPIWIVELFLRSRLGHAFFGAGGVPAVYSSPSTSMSSCVPPSTSQAQVPRNDYELLCLAPNGLEELFDPNLLDPYMF